jgi:hypothetical protein
MIVYRRIILRMKNVSDRSCRENQNTHFIINKFFWKSCVLKDNVEKYGTEGQATNDDTVRRRKDAKYSHTLIVFNTYCRIAY